ncbi:hypothetical protein O9H85_37005 [Paenibacillus filicis]|uniref:Uncharacterized protein n=1 Tax=Paenibacillus gyeongsangnamensis TaxID=3388067 RepID=A0ABT4QLV6_9BACL|nr:hypothetical protein [Paenibacillus filicis]MCZ8517792.1 hypothetical protein [Paenibacillus filicis]
MRFANRIASSVTLPPEYIIEGIRADCGFADPAVMGMASTSLMNERKSFIPLVFPG